MLTPAECRALERAGRKAVEAIEERNRVIREAYANGASLREIAACIGTIKYSAVHKIVRPVTPPRDRSSPS